MTWEHLYKLRDMIRKAAVSLTDTDALTAIEMFAPWQTDMAYTVDTRIRYNGKLYRVVQSHTSQSDWTPDVTPALFTEVAEPGTIPVWKQPTGAQDAYMTGDKVRYPDEYGDIYICDMNFNAYAPDVYGWTKM